MLCRSALDCLGCAVLRRAVPCGALSSFLQALEHAFAGIFGEDEQRQRERERELQQQQQQKQSGSGSSKSGGGSGTLSGSGSGSWLSARELLARMSETCRLNEQTGPIAHLLVKLILRRSAQRGGRAWQVCMCMCMRICWPGVRACACSAGWCACACPAGQGSPEMHACIDLQTKPACLVFSKSDACSTFRFSLPPSSRSFASLLLVLRCVACPLRQPPLSPPARPPARPPCF